MKKKRLGTILIIAALAGIYVALLLVMLHAEAGSETSSIQSFPDAIWYSVVTLTTVGYGDVTPSTPVGHAVGIVFLLMSTGILITLVGTLLSFLSSEGFPLLMLSFQKKKNWYFFADMSLESDALARQIYERDAGAVIIYGQSQSVLDEKPDYPCLFINVSPERIVKRKKGKGSRCKVFLMKENDIGTNPRAVGIAALPVDVYARTVSGEDNFSGNIHFFNSYDCCAREYWRNKPLTTTESSIALIGFGFYGQALLERAIMTNVLDPAHRVAYHIFGEVGNFLEIHPGLRLVFSIGEESEEKDSLIFHDTAWSEAHALLATFDRIIICDDDEQIGWDVFWKLRRFYILKGRIDLRSNRPVPGVSHFGTNASIYTPEHVLRTTMNQVAIAMNNQYMKQHPTTARSWEELEDYLRQSKIAASEHLFMKVRMLLGEEALTELTPEMLGKAHAIYTKSSQNPRLLDQYRRMEHVRWIRFYAFYNWTYGEVYNREKREDPRMQKYSALTDAQKATYDNAWTLIKELRWTRDDF